jgi:HSP20 family molecular chaperone IbpA
MERQTAVATKRSEQLPGPRLLAIDDVMARMNAFIESIALRAFEIFRGRGGTEGYDLEDWLQAEAELLHPMHLHVTESSDAFVVRAEVPGFSNRELEIGVEPRRLLITGRRQTRGREPAPKVVYSDSCSDQVLRVFAIPADVDPRKVTAALNDGILELAMPKAVPSAELRLEAKTSSIVRVTDDRAWRHSFMAAGGQ